MSSELPPPTGAATQPPSSAISGWMLLLPSGMVLVVVSIFTEWGTEQLFDRSRTATAIPSQLLWDTTPASLDSAPLMWPLGIAVALMLITLVRPITHPAFGLVGGAVAAGVSLLYVNAIRAVLDDPFFNGDQSLTDGIGVGTWLCLAGGVMALIGSIVNMRRRAPG